jgi:methyl-accepting chemotaxis protein
MSSFEGNGNGNGATDALLKKKGIKKIDNNEDLSESLSKQKELEGQLDAINSSSAFIEFKPDGTIIRANHLFLACLKYTNEQIEGKHHRIFCESGYAGSREYVQFWDDLRKGLSQVGEFRRIAKDGSDVWIQATYTPVKNDKGHVISVIKLATDITEQKVRNADYQGQLEAINKSQAVIQFNMDGTIVMANELFLNVMGYTLNEIKGKHHSVFVETVYGNSAEYKEFWAKLNRGQYLQDEYKRIGKGGKEVWIQASYNPIMDLSGKPFKVVKYATDVTEQRLRNADFSGQVDAIGKSQAVIQFNMDGTIITANDNFLNTVGYTLNEVKGKHHSLFVETAYANSPEYKSFWAKLNNGQFLMDEYKRLGKGGKEVWIQASYNPIMDLNNRPFKVVKYATEITEQKNRDAQFKEQVNTISDVILEIANGDLANRVTLNATGDIQAMANALNTAIDNISNLLLNIGKNADVVSSSSVNMLDKTESMKRSTTEVASAISQMAKGAQDQATRTDESSKLVEKVKTSADEMERKANAINQAAEKGQKGSENGLKTMKVLVNNMTGIRESAQQTSKSIEVLAQRAEEIGRTLKVITDIASQTNLLALNAAIEAARAGDAGRGFAVVAEEIRKLAEDSRKSAVDIEKIISDVQKDTGAASKAIDTMHVSVKEGGNATNEAEVIFQEIATSTQTTFEFSKQIQDATKDQKSSIDLVVKNIEQIVVVAEETAAGTQQAASSSQQLSNAMGEIAEGSNKLTGVAKELQAGVEKFKLKKAI